MKYFHELLEQYNHNIPVGTLIHTKNYDEIIINRDPNARARPQKTKTILVGNCNSLGGISNHCRVESSVQISKIEKLPLSLINWKYNVDEYDFSHFSEEFHMVSSTLLAFSPINKPGLVIDLGEEHKNQYIILGNISPNGGLCDASQLEELNLDLTVIRYGFLI